MSQSKVWYGNKLFCNFFQALWVIKYGVERKAKVETPKFCLQNGHMPSFIAQRTFHSLLMCWQHNTVKQENLPFHLKSPSKMRKQSLFTAKETQQLRDTPTRRATYMENFVFYTFFNIELNVFFTISKVECYQVITETESAVTHKEQLSHRLSPRCRHPTSFILTDFLTSYFIF